MIRRIIIFIVALMLSFSQIWVPGPGISIWFGTMDIVHRGLILQSAYAETKQISPKSSQKSISNKKESVKPELQSRKPDGLTFESNNFPDGVTGRRYSFVLVPANANPPFNVTLVLGTLPPGLKLDQRTGGIEGEPNQAGVYNLTLQFIDAKNKKGNFSGAIRLWRALTVGEHGTLKGADGLQMVLNMAQDMDEIRIEEGTYGVSGLKIPQNKTWVYGIKITGGWNETFDKKSNGLGATILDGEGKKDRILTISNSKGIVSIENLTFRNSKGGAVEINRESIFNDCIFTHNSGGEGGSVYINTSAVGIFDNCTFISNSAIFGGAVYNRGNGFFNNCTFTKNSVHNDYMTKSAGGAVFVHFNGNSRFDNCTFTDNLAGSVGGAVHLAGKGDFSNCTFTSNLATEEGGAVVVNSSGSFTRCTFTNNSATQEGGAVVVNDRGSFTNSIFVNNRAENGGAVYAKPFNIGTFTNCTFYGNNAKKEGGALYAKFKGKIINSIFYKNTADGKDNDIKVEDNLDIDYSLINYLKGAANFGPKNIMGDPKFLSPENGDLHLRSESPAISAGKTSPELGYGTIDLDGKPRVGGGKIDMGAYEWQGK